MSVGPKRGETCSGKRYEWLKIAGEVRLFWISLPFSAIKRFLDLLRHPLHLPNLTHRHEKSRNLRVHVQLPKIL